MGRQPKPQLPRRENPLKQKRDVINAPTIFTQRAASNAKKTQAPRRIGCGNADCRGDTIEDGICTACGKIVDDSNIVSEVQFGEAGNGAAVVQGSFIGADQGGARSSGPGFPRGGGSEEGREATVREGKRVMQAMAHQLHVSERIVNTAGQILKLAAMNNFIQGRRMDVVCAVVLYSACRQTRPCRVMLIDFADRLQVNVFKLGRTFKALHESVSFAKDGIFPVVPEDLIWRFAAKLEFGTDCNKVAEDAVRMVKRMSLDWMVMGRRPSGVCGACLILAARMNNYRRTITEVVYVVKVTTHTIQKRLDEFKMTPSSALTVDEFLNNEFLESAHDPPSFYEKTEEYQKTKKRRKRKRMGPDGAEGAEDEDDDTESVDGEGPNKRQRSETTPNPDQALPTVELRRDADGFAIPPPPSQSQSTSQPTPDNDMPIDPDLVDEIISDQAGTSFDKLVAQFGDATSDNRDAGESQSTPDPSPGKNQNKQQIHVPREWARAEEQMEKEMTELLSDPNTVQHAVHYAEAEKRVAKHMAVAMVTQKNLPFDVNSSAIGEDEFADDIEVQHSILSEEESEKKERLWINENKGWLRTQQIKAFQKKQDALGPPKAKRNRKKKARIGEGQASPANTPAEALAGVWDDRVKSKKINYDAMAEMLESAASGLGSASTSRAGSRAPSEIGDSTPASTVASTTAGRPIDESSEVGDLSDYNDPNDFVDPNAEESVEGSVGGDQEDFSEEEYGAFDDNDDNDNEFD